MPSHIEQEKIRNVAIIAHVDHGKTTLVDKLFNSSGMFRSNQSVEERLMDNIDLEKERGITIASKNASFVYADHRINIIDTPGHADFGGQVERVLKLADGAILLVDAQEGPMPQTYFVLKKALALHLPVILVINKIDKPAARAEEVVDEVFDLFAKLEAPDEILDFPYVFASSLAGYAINDMTDEPVSMEPLCEKIISHIPPPRGDAHDPLQMLVSSIDYSPYLGRLGIGKITGGVMNINSSIACAYRDGHIAPARITKIYRFEGAEKVPAESATTGEIVAVAGMDDITVGVTFTDPEKPHPLPPMTIDPPTISMHFLANDSPFAGREGSYVTSSNLADRLQREALGDVALKVETLEDQDKGFKVSGRGELHLSILIERMRREGYELQVTRPQVIMQNESGQLLEPYERLTVDVDENYMGNAIEILGRRKGEMQEMETREGLARIIYRIPTRGLLGFRSQFLSETRGMGVMNYVFDGYGPHAGEIKHRKNGVLIAMDGCRTVAYALFNLQERGRLFVEPGVNVYKGQIIGENARENDLPVNPAKGKKLTNVRASGTDENVVLTPVTHMSLEDCLAFINDDELVEVTPQSIRLRKRNFRK